MAGPGRGPVGYLVPGDGRPPARSRRPGGPAQRYRANPRRFARDSLPAVRIPGQQVPRLDEGLVRGVFGVGLGWPRCKSGTAPPGCTGRHRTRSTPRASASCCQAPARGGARARAAGRRPSSRQGSRPAAAAVGVLGTARAGPAALSPGPALRPGLYPRGQHRAGRADRRGHHGCHDGWVHGQLPSAALRAFPVVASEGHPREGAARKTCQHPRRRRPRCLRMLAVC